MFSEVIKIVWSSQVRLFQLVSTLLVPGWVGLRYPAPCSANTKLSSITWNFLLLCFTVAETYAVPEKDRMYQNLKDGAGNVFQSQLKSVKGVFVIIVRKGRVDTISMHWWYQLEYIYPVHLTFLLRNFRSIITGEIICCLNSLSL